MTDTKTGRQLTDTGCSEDSRPVLFFYNKDLQKQLHVNIR